MHLQRFRGQTVADALEAARVALGPEALVLGTRLVPLAGWRGFVGAREVEVTAATERAVSAERPERQADRHQGGQPLDGLRAQLCAAGLDAAVVDEVAGSFGRDHGRVSPADVRRALTSWTAAIAEGEDDDARVEVFVGPTGAGKTTTVAKIAARARISAGRRLGLVSTDTFRVGAIEPLRLYAEIIGSPFVAARTPAELAAAVTAGPAPVLVDTAARAGGDGNTRDLLSILASAPGARIHLVVPAGITAVDFTRVLGAYAAVRPQRVVITKMDEGGSIAALAGVLRGRGLRVSYLGTGQRVPEDLRRATPAAIAAALVGDARRETGHAA